MKLKKSAPKSIYLFKTLKKLYKKKKQFREHKNKFYINNFVFNT